MDVLLAPIGQWLLSQGLPGIVILALGYAVYILDARLKESQESRLSEKRDMLREVTKALAENTVTLQSVSATQDKAAEASRDNSEAIKLLAAKLDRGG